MKDTYALMKMEDTECSETSAYKIHTPGNYPEESIKHSEHGESLKLSFACAFSQLCLLDEVIQKKKCHFLSYYIL